MKGDDLVVFIMARGGSTRVPLKNIAPIGDRIVISFTLAAVGEMLERLPRASAVLMTDSPQIEDAVRGDAHCLPGLIFHRETDDEGGDSMEWAAISRALRELDPGQQWRYAMLLGADCVSRTAETLIAAYERLRELPDPFVMVQSVMRVPTNYHSMRRVAPPPGSDWEWETTGNVSVSQSWPDEFVKNGDVHAMTTASIRRDPGRVEERISGIVTGPCLEIDTFDDLRQARMLHQAGRL